VISANRRTKSHGVRPGSGPEKQAATVVVRDLDSRKSPKTFDEAPALGCWRFSTTRRSEMKRQVA
jgi:hypothetical protein